MCWRDLISLVPETSHPERAMLDIKSPCHGYVNGAQVTTAAFTLPTERFTYRSGAPHVQVINRRAITDDAAAAASSASLNTFEGPAVMSAKQCHRKRAFVAATAGGESRGWFLFGQGRSTHSA